MRREASGESRWWARKTAGNAISVMVCAANYTWSDTRNNADLGMKGGGALGSLLLPSDWWECAAFDEESAVIEVATPE